MKADIFSSIKKHITEAEYAYLLSYLYSYLPDLENEKNVYLTMKDRLLAVMNTTSYLVSIKSITGYFLYVNNVWLNEFGWNFEEFTTKPYYAFIHPDDRDRTRKKDAQILNNKGASINDSIINRYRTKDGRYKKINWHVYHEYKPKQKLFMSIAELI